MNENQEVTYDSSQYIHVDKLTPKPSAVVNQRGDSSTNSNTGTNILQKIRNSDVLKKLTSIKHFKPIAIVICFVVVALVIMNYVPKSADKAVSASTSASSVDYTSSKQYVDNLESKLTSLLSSISGAGRTKVMVTIESGPEIKVANTVEEKTTTTSSGSTVTVVTNPILIEQKGEQVPLILMEVVPKVKGVIVVSEGASNAKVKMDMYTAIKALLDIPSGNIEIFTGI